MKQICRFLSRRGMKAMTIGLILIIAALCLTMYNYIDSYRAARAANELANELASQITGDGSQYYLVDPDIEMPTIDIGDRDCVGYVEIPALGLSLPVLSEWSYPNLKVAPMPL